MSELEKFTEWSDSFLMSVRFREVAWMAWQAALSTRKDYGYGIVDKDGKAYLAFDALVVSDDSVHLESTVMEANEWEEQGHRVVELFYEDSES